MSKILLKDRLEFLYGFSVRVNDEAKGKYPVYGSNGITGYIDNFKIEGPGVIIGRKGTVGAINFSKDNFTPTDTAYYLVLKDKRQDDIKFWCYYLQLLGLNKLNTHSSVPGLSREVAYFIKVNPPSFTTQQKIASVLSSLDSKIDHNNRINAVLEVLAKTLYDYWFVQFEFPDKNGNPYKTSGGKIIWNKELKREIPDGWKNGLFSDIGNITGGSTPPKDVSEYFSLDGIAWITPKDLSINLGNKFITKGELDVSEQGAKAASLKIMPKGTILLSSRAPIGYLAIARESLTTNQGFKSFVPKSGYSTSFIYYAIKNALPEIINNASGSTFKEISGGTLKTIKICIPEINVIQNYTIKVAAIFERQSNLELENQKLAQLRNWLLPLLMNGQVKLIEKDQNKVKVTSVNL